MRKFEVAKGFEGRGVNLPKRGSTKSAGYDFESIEDIIIPSHETVLVNTGIKASMADNEVLMIFVRSSSAIKKGLILRNGTAIIDADYYNNEDNDGHIMLAIHNTFDSPYRVTKGERLAQGIFVQYGVTNDDDTYTERSGGIGSTDKETSKIKSPVWRIEVEYSNDLDAGVWSRNSNSMDVEGSLWARNKVTHQDGNVEYTGATRVRSGK